MITPTIIPWAQQCTAPVSRRVQFIGDGVLQAVVAQLVDQFHAIGYAYSDLVIEVRPDTLAAIKRDERLVDTVDFAHSLLYAAGYVGEWFGCRLAVSERDAVTVFAK